MQVWLAVCAHRDAVAPETIDWVRDHEWALLPFDDGPASRHRWESDDGVVHLWSWDSGQDVVDAAVAATSDGGALTAAGYVLDAGRLQSHAALGEAMAASGSPSELVGGWGGIYSLCRVDGNGRLWARASRGRLQSVFHTTVDDVTVVANRPELAHRVARRSLIPDIDDGGLTQLLASGLTGFDRLPLLGVEQLADGAELVCHGSSVDVRQIEPHPVMSGDGDAAALTSALIESVSFLGDCDHELQLSLTGGKDSRLVAALLREAGVPFSAATSGSPDHPDVVIGAKVAEHLGVAHKVVPLASGHVPTGLVDIGERLWRVRGGSDGTLSGFDNPLANRVVGPAVKLGGAGGEVLRGGMARSADVDTDVMWRKVRAQLAGHADRLVPEAAARVDAQCSAWADTVAHMSPAEVLAWYHREIRLGRWNMSRALQQAGGALLVQPFLDSQVVARAMELPLAHRTSERAFHSVLALLDPELAAMPLATSHWRFDPGGAPRTSPGDVFNWRTQLRGTTGGALREVIESSPARERLFALVDGAKYDAMWRDSVDRSSNHERPARFLWSMASAAVLCAGEQPVGAGLLVSTDPPSTADPPATAAG